MSSARRLGVSEVGRRLATRCSSTPSSSPAPARRKATRGAPLGRWRPSQQARIVPHDAAPPSFAMTFLAAGMEWDRDLEYTLRQGVPVHI